METEMGLAKPPILEEDKDKQDALQRKEEEDKKRLEEEALTRAKEEEDKKRLEEEALTRAKEEEDKKRLEEEALTRAKEEEDKKRQEEEALTREKENKIRVLEAEAMERKLQTLEEDKQKELLIRADEKNILDDGYLQLPGPTKHHAAAIYQEDPDGTLFTNQQRVDTSELSDMEFKLREPTLRDSDDPWGLSDEPYAEEERLSDKNITVTTSFLKNLTDELSSLKEQVNKLTARKGRNKRSAQKQRSKGQRSKKKSTTPEGEDYMEEAVIPTQKPARKPSKTKKKKNKKKSIKSRKKKKKKRKVHHKRKGKGDDDGKPGLFESVWGKY
jgi:hypothetical protein